MAWVRERLFRPLRHVLREKLAAGELDGFERPRVRQLLVTTGLCEDLCKEVERVAKQHGFGPQLAEANPAGEGSQWYEWLSQFVRDHWDDLIIQAIFYVLPMVLGDDDEAKVESEQ